jgi:hypothetical protein
MGLVTTIRLYACVNSGAYTAGRVYTTVVTTTIRTGVTTTTKLEI